MNTVIPMFQPDYDAGSILIVEDDQLMIDLLLLYLQEAGFSCEVVKNAEDAWGILNRQSVNSLNHSPQQSFDCVLLDRNLPGISGLELLQKIKSSPALMELPVIMETAEGSDDAILEGLNNGAYYYLTKPVDRDRLISTLNTCVSDFRRHQYLKKEVKSLGSIFQNCQEGRFQFQTLLECQRLAVALAHMFPEPERVIFGLSELMTNAVEHGNLEIGYNRKSQLLAEELLIDEIDERLEQQAFASRLGGIHLIKNADSIVVTISDEGQGFDWQPYLTLSIDRVFDQHGRGIAMARENSFDKLEYQGNGNTVVCTVYLS